MIIDTHCHLDFKEFNEDFNDVLLNAKNNNISGMQTICTKIDEFPKILDITKNIQIYGAQLERIRIMLRARNIFLKIILKIYVIMTKL